MDLNDITTPAQQSASAAAQVRWRIRTDTYDGTPTRINGGAFVHQVTIPLQLSLELELSESGKTERILRFRRPDR